LDWSEELFSEINNNAELVLDIDVKKKVKTGSSIYMHTSGKNSDSIF
jgi:hypothetical protein